MPIYEYQCKACGERLEKFQKSGAEPLQECPNCGKLQLDKLISAAGFKLSGTGWYETDFKNKPKAESTQSASADTAKKPDPSAAKKDSVTPSTKDKS